MRAQNREEYDEAVAIILWLRRKAWEAALRASPDSSDPVQQMGELMKRVRLARMATELAEVFLLPENW